MKPSVFTPSHRTDYLDECYATLSTQTLTDWEWVVLLNGGADWTPPSDDARVRVLRGSATTHVGALKREACAAATGDVLVELDHDDLLAPTCLQEVVEAFDAHPDAVLVYSDFAQINHDGSANFERFNTAMGWEYAPANVYGVLLDRCRAMAPTPHNVSYIWYAPNHVRAFRRSAYDAVGGYDAGLEILDDQDLMMRLFAAGPFVHLPRCLYLQRIHPSNTQRDSRINRDIQEKTVAMYWASIEQLTTAWSRREGLGRLSLRTATSPTTTPIAGASVVELDPTDPRLPFEDDSVGTIHAAELLQRVIHRRQLFEECHRVLAHGGMLHTLTPSTDGRGAFQDPTHLSLWNENSFWYHTQAGLRDQAFPGTPMRFQVSGIRTHFPTAFDEENDISYVAANLLAIKEGPRNGGPLLC